MSTTSASDTYEAPNPALGVQYYRRYEYGRMLTTVLYSLHRQINTSEIAKIVSVREVAGHQS